VKIRVQNPDGVVGVRPIPKPNSSIDLVNGTSNKPYGTFHDSVAESVKQAPWDGIYLTTTAFVVSTYVTDGLVNALPDSNE
jgi:uncharacterized protein YcnI